MNVILTAVKPEPDHIGCCFRTFREGCLIEISFDRKQQHLIFLPKFFSRATVYVTEMSERIALKRDEINTIDYKGNIDHGEFFLISRKLIPGRIR
jgi:hypothetical protein